MANAKVCDNPGCKAVLILDARNGHEDEDGEINVWVTIQTADREWIACTRSCAIELLADGGPVAGLTDAMPDDLEAPDA